MSSHRFHDSRSADLLATSVGLTLSARIEGDTVVAEIEVANLGTGHHLPAGSPMRHMLVLVSADADGAPLTRIDGPALPEWAGDMHGKPGRGFAKLLGDKGVVPAPAWQATAVVSDTRIPAGELDRSQYRFRLDRPVTARIGAVLVIRRT